ncbi:CSC1-like protein 2 isoform X2 [Biomphalaria glabrata]|uniref:CSC1-like protein 2 isoform X3 n=1 Tax=Biomphalaria glabrata TaxID=6526 RepID=A0A2C9LTU6_BIOGL|nr:CSC1-like protein 2 isoform X3 [Biomphalaria glabrata]KAI8747578.1 CSC1-like protein 2 isoform X2 [Biomphalaria glabrata]
MSSITVSPFKFSNESPNCEEVARYGNSTHVFLYDKYNGIPDTLIINLVVFVCLLLLFTILRKIAWDYGRLALVNRTEENDGVPLVVRRPKVEAIRKGRSGYNVWTSLFFGDRDRRSFTGSQESLDTTVTSQDKGMFRWIVAFWRLRDVDILNKCGRDAIQYLSFQRYLLVYISIITVLSVGVILPLNFQGSLLGTSADFGHTTIGNLESNDPILWVHAVMAVVYLVIVIGVLSHFRLNLDVEEDEQVSRTLMVSNIPKHKCFHSTILQHFEEAYPEANVTDIQFAYDIAGLVLLDKHRKRAAEAKQFCENIYKTTGQRPMMRPVICGQICCCCAEVDAINFYQAEEAELKKACEEEKETAYQTPLGIAFITLASESQAQRIRTDFRASCKGTHNPQMSSLYQELQVQNWIMHFAPSPESIHWENLSVPDWRWWTTAICINGVLIVLLFFLTTPIMFLHTLDMLNIDIKKPVENLHSAYLVQFLPTLLLWIFSALLPSIVYWSDQIIGHWTKTAEHHAIMRKTFIFILFMVLILPSLGLTSAKALFEWIVMSKTRSLQWQCIFLPGNGSFFVNYIITSAFIGAALELLRFSELFIYGVKLLFARSVAERAAVRKSVLWDFQYGVQYAWMLCMVAIIVSYSIPCPLVTPFGLIYLLFKHVVDRYNIFFAYNSSRINKHIHGSAVTFVLWAVILLQFNVVFFTGLRAEGFDPVFIFSCVALFITLIIFVGRISFGWFKHLRRPRYRNFEESEPDSMVNSDDTLDTHISKPFVASVLTQDLSLEHEQSSSSHTSGYGATHSTLGQEDFSSIPQSPLAQIS